MDPSSRDLGDAERKGQPKPPQPGDNPNKAAAQRRKANRPKARNSPSVKTEKIDSFRWIDPLPVVEPSSAILEQNIDSVPAGYIDQRFELPTTISEPFVEAVTHVLDRTNLPEDAVTRVGDKLHAMCYYKAARQLYSTLSNPDKSELQPLKAVYYDDTHLPVHMNAAISMIGNLETKLGTIEIRDAPVLFKRWIVKGLTIDPDSNIDDSNVDPTRCVWRDRSSKTMIDRMAREKIATIRQNTSFRVTLDTGDVISVGVPPIAISDQGYNSITDEYPEHDVLRDLVSLLQCTTSDFIHSRALPHARDVAAALDHLGLELADAEEAVANIRDEFENCIRDYLVDVNPQVKAVFNVSPPPATGTGFAGQIVQSEGNCGRFKLPLSDADRALGYMFNPSTCFELHPRFVMYGRRRNDDTAAMFAASDIRNLASD